MKDLRHRYYLLYRPPALFTHPDGEVARDSWQPIRAIPELPGVRAHGWVEYDEPLTLEQVYDKELLPADRAQRAIFRWWNYNGNDGRAAVRALARFYEMREKLEQYGDTSNRTRLALELIEALEEANDE